jgi:hypothetical protein
MSAEAIAGAGLAKSVLGLLECNGEALGGESGILAWLASTAALFPKGLAELGADCWGSLNGLSWLAAPGRSQALVGRCGSSLPTTAPAAKTGCGRHGADTGRRLSSRRGKLDLGRRWCRCVVVHAHLLVVLGRSHLVLLAAVHKQDTHEKGTNTDEDTKSKSSFRASRHTLRGVSRSGG